MSRLHLRSCALTLCACLWLACGSQVPASAPARVTPDLPAPTVAKVVESGENTEQHLQEQVSIEVARDTFDRRCVVCHGCYDAPCQLILSSQEGIARGASKTAVYQGSRLLAVVPTRLYVDGRTVSDWRSRGFAPMLSDGTQGDPRANLLVRMLELKRDHPLIPDSRLPRGFELGLDRKAVCPTADEYERYTKDYPLWGMPYALPGLSEPEHQSLLDWLTKGAPHVAKPALAPAVLDSLSEWERFLNAPSPKGRLMARYIYEHLFLASLYFAGIDQNSFFRLVRSRTPPGEIIDEIPTRRPFEDPGSAPFYYRLLRKHDTRLEKTHMPYALHAARMARYTELFLTPEYEVKSQPSYQRDVAANPFRTFQDIPVASRYRFMLDEAEFTLMGFIKGPVCRGQIALDVIQDRFWITFVNPDSPMLEGEDAFFASVADSLELPADGGSNATLLSWLRYARNQKKFLQAKSAYLAGKQDAKVNLDVIWDGAGTNPNAALTVLRHFDSATVMKGLLGGPPKTAWVISYAVLERIHYLLVAGFDVFGNIGHQLNTRMYMDFLRMEAEHNFLLLLPNARRSALVDAWYRGVSASVKDAVHGNVARFEREPDLVYTTARPELELFNMLIDKLAPVRENFRNLVEHPDPRERELLGNLARMSGKPATLMPETSFIELHDPASSQAHYFTLLRDSAHSNVARLFGEDKRRRPAEDRLTVLRGFVGAYPNAIFSVNTRELAGFVETIGSMKNQAAFDLMHARFGVSRTSPRFWPTLDRMHGAAAQLTPLEAGLFDLNRLQRH